MMHDKKQRLSDKGGGSRVYILGDKQHLFLYLKENKQRFKSATKCSSNFKLQSLKHSITKIQFCGSSFLDIYINFYSNTFGQQRFKMQKSDTKVTQIRSIHIGRPIGVNQLEWICSCRVCPLCGSV